MSEAKLRAFAALVARWSVKINLVGRNDIPHIWGRHVLDSLALAPLLPPGLSAAIDLGSGAGFPGMVLAIATGIPFILIESDVRKSSFLREAARQTGAPVSVVNSRIEVAKLAPAQVVTARALAPLDRLLGLAAPFLTPGGFCLFPKGASAEAELTAAERLWQMEVERFAAAAAGSVVLKVSRIRHVGPG